MDIWSKHADRLLDRPHDLEECARLPQLTADDIWAAAGKSPGKMALGPLRVRSKEFQRLSQVALECVAAAFS
eukprot:6389200-Pyramimonas_sp.AAC.1